MKHYIITLVVLGFYQHAIAQSNTGIPIRWLDDSPVVQPVGLSWGMPWPRGTVKKDHSFSLTDAMGKNVPLQSWTTAYWPDGSVKWSGFAAVAGTSNGALQLGVSTTKPIATTSALVVTDKGETVTINTGALRCVIRRKGNFLIDSLLVENRLVASSGRLEAILQQGPDGEEFESPAKEKFTSRITSVTVEQTGPVRSVVKVDGKMQSAKATREWLPFSIRLYFYAGSQAVRLVNTIIY